MIRPVSHVTTDDTRTPDAADGAQRSRGIKDWVGLLARLVLGGALFIAGALKIGDLESSVQAVRAYQLVPYDLAKWVGYAMPAIELIVGAMILAGFLTRWTALLGTLMMAAFIVAISWAWSKGLSIDCGCFGGGGEVGATETKYPQEILRDVAFIAAGLWLIVRPRSALAVDNLLFPDDEYEA